MLCKWDFTIWGTTCRCSRSGRQPKTVSLKSPLFMVTGADVFPSLVELLLLPVSPIVLTASTVT
jgi:hypothetical protein